MQKATQVALLNELLALNANKSPFLDDRWETIDCERYVSQARFAAERSRIHHALPQIAAHGSSLAEVGSFKTDTFCGVPLLLVRDKEGRARAFYNVCRHRGAELVAEEEGCKQRFSCPYHAWTWDNAGKLIGVPHEKSGFPEMDREQLSLRAIPCAEYAGWIWVQLGGEGSELDVGRHLGDMAADLNALGAANYCVFDQTSLDIPANWKLLVEGGLEAYHFRVAHRNTIAPLFLDNLSSYQCIGPHMRSILPRSILNELQDIPESEWSVVKYANVLYSLFPGSQFLVQEDHFVWIQGIPEGSGRTRLLLSTMIPGSDNGPEKQDYWRRNHELTIKTLIEDFDLAEGIQRGLESGANRQLNFGRFEGALAAFNRIVDQAIA